MEKILITGGVGFLGFSLAQYMSYQNNYEIFLLDNFMYCEPDEEVKNLLEKNNVTLIQADLTDANSVNSLDLDFNYIYHFAARKFNIYESDKADRIIYDNTVSTLNLLEFSKRLKNLKRFVFASTGEVYSGTLKHFGIEIPTDEHVKIALDDLREPRTTYPLSKILGESACYNYGEIHNIPFTILRFHNLYGPRMGNFGLMPDMFKKISNSKKVEVFAPNHTRDFTYITDAIAITLKAAEHENAKNEMFNIGDQNNEITILDLVKLIAKMMKKEIDILEKPDFSNAPSRRCANTKKIEDILNYKHTVGFEVGLLTTYNWYRDNFN